MRKLSIPLAMAFLTGCTTTTASTPALTDSHWRFTAIDGTSPTGEAMLSFQGDRLSASAGCNRMAGAWRSEAGKLIAGPLMATKMFCEGRMEQERVVGELLAGSPGLAISGDVMTLKNAAHFARLARQR